MRYNSAADSLICTTRPSKYAHDFLRHTERKRAKNGHFAFLRPPLGGGGLEAETEYDVHLYRLIGKRVCLDDFLSY